MKKTASEGKGLPFFGVPKMLPFLAKYKKELLVMVTTGDEILDWRRTPGVFPKSPVWTVPGSDHAVSDISRYIDALFSFLLRGDVPETLPAAAQHD